MSGFVPPGPGQPPEEPPGSPPQQQPQQQPWPQQYPGQPPYGVPPQGNLSQALIREQTSRKMSGWGLGLSLLICVPLAPIVGLVLGVVVLVRSQGGGDHGRGKAIAATVIGGLYVLVFVGAIVFGVVEGFRDGFDDDPERDETTGEVTDSGDLIPAKLRVGDCFNEPKLEDLGPTEQFETDLIAVVPCSEPHDAEVYHAFQLTGGEYPDQTEIDREATACVREFKTFVGVGYARTQLDFVYYFPSQQSWDLLDDRGIVCSIFDPVRGRVTGSLEGSRR